MDENPYFAKLLEHFLYMVLVLYSSRIFNHMVWCLEENKQIRALLSQCMVSMINEKNIRFGSNFIPPLHDYHC